MTERIAVFGGTFDPIHVGHLAIAEAARRALGTGEVVFVPTARNPLKRDEPSVPAEDRYEMVRRARVRTLDSPLVDLPSRELREYARAGGSLRYLVPEPAWRYMVTKGLYGQGRERR